jgi:hypothetical protein
MPTGKINMRRAILILAAAWVNFGSSFSAEPNIRLFKEFTLGMRYQTVRKMPGITDKNPADPDLPITDDVLYRADVEFAGFKWLQVLAFDNYKALAAVELVSGMSEDNIYPRTAMTIVNSGFTLASIGKSETEDEAYDFIEDIVANGIAAAEKNMARHEQEALDGGYIELYYIDDESLQKMMPRYRVGMSDMEGLQLLPSSARVVLVVASEGGEDQNPWISVTFTAPKALLVNLKEDF